MSNINKIVIPFDFTEPAIAALDYGLKFVGFERPILLEAVYASSSEVTENEKTEVRENFSKIVDSLKRHTKIRPTLRVLHGDLVDTILNERNQQDADLILMGTLGDVSVEEHVTNTAKLVLEADCPVITVPFGPEMDIPKNIALVLGKEEIENPKVLGLLLHIARSFDAKVHVLTIYKESIYGENAVVETNEESLEYYLEHFYAEHSFTKNEDIEKGIYDYIEEKNIDLLAILPRNHAQKTKPSEGRLTKLLTLHATVPVLTLD
ncbi:universal stress protein [uncultured Croceitalea sp.]|uniref:universal stress protein n=1 Tax=uncultured Croceitalea sp. TaxID=1798908 RepID=UPI003306433F